MGNKFLFVIIVFELIFCALNSQQMYPVRGTVYVREGKPSKVALVVSSQNKEEYIPVDIDGGFVTNLAWNKNYQFCFSKPGYVSKKVTFSTHIPSEVSKNTIYPYEILIELFPTFPDVDTVFFKKPVAKIKYSDFNKDFNYDLNYQLVVNKKIKEIKQKYLQWKTKSLSKSKTANLTTIKTQKKAVLHYQKSVEVEKNKTNAHIAPKITRLAKYNTTKNKDPFNLPPLKSEYSEGKTIEIHKLKGKIITRIIMKNGNYQKAFYKVLHNWGGLYYFVQESPSYYRSISEYNFEKATKN